MKKQFLLAVVTLLMVSACQPKTPNLDDRINQPGSEMTDTGEASQMYIGVLKPIDSNRFKRGTHQLITATGEIALQSSRISLSNFVDQKVQVKGEMQTLIDNKTQVFNVLQIELADESALGQKKQYQSASDDLTFEYPAYWEQREGVGSITFRHNAEDLVQINTIDTDLGLDAWVADRENSVGQPVTISGKSALRFQASDSIRFYIENTARQKVIQIQLLKRDENVERDFLAMIESIQIAQTSVKSGDQCGGAEQLACAEGFRCELNGGDQASEGVCVPINSTDESLNCPFVPVPAGCTNYKPRTYNQNKCPTGYVCLDEPKMPEASIDVDEQADRQAQLDALIAEKQESDSTEPITSARNVIAFFNQQNLIPTDAEVVRHEVVESDQILFVIYTQNGETFRAGYQYTLVNNTSLQFNQKALYRAEKDKVGFGVRRGDSNCQSSKCRAGTCRTG
ncbi:hypothetical protein IPJ72_05200 [Candidatus Peregrinibacteria bacterium]|nr:MAG: hypothetical protein IPJ72_05200 [Candidatus Peregrinibacteria bacterium]